MYIAVEKGHAEIIQRLLAAGSDPDRARNDGACPVLIAAKDGASRCPGVSRFIHANLKPQG